MLVLTIMTKVIIEFSEIMLAQKQKKKPQISNQFYKKKEKNSKFSNSTHAIFKNIFGVRVEINVFDVVVSQYVTDAY